MSGSRTDRMRAVTRTRRIEAHGAFPAAPHNNAWVLRPKWELNG